MNYQYQRDVASDGQYDLGNPQRGQSVEEQIAAAFTSEHFTTVSEDDEFVVCFDRDLTGVEASLLDTIIADYKLNVSLGNNPAIQDTVCSIIDEGTVVLNGSGEATIVTNKVSAETVLHLTPQSTPLGVVYVSLKLVETSISVASTAGSADSGLIVGYLLVE